MRCITSSLPNSIFHSVNDLLVYSLTGLSFKTKFITLYLLIVLKAYFCALFKYKIIMNSLKTRDIPNVKCVNLTVVDAGPDSRQQYFSPRLIWICHVSGVVKKASRHWQRVLHGRVSRGQGMRAKENGKHKHFHLVLRPHVRRCSGGAKARFWTRL